MAEQTMQNAQPVDVLAEGVLVGCGKCGSDHITTQARVDRCDFMCRPCKAAYARERRAQRKALGTPYRRNKDRAAEYEKERNQRPEVRARRAADMARYARDPHLRARHEARWQVRRAIASGRLTRLSCEVCGAEKTHGHHDDYSKPLEVRWLCQTHHREHHARIGGAA